MGDYPEHDKLSKISGESQQIGEFLAWLGDRGMQVMRWHEGDETVDGCFSCQPHRNGFAEEKCTEHQRCDQCQGTHQHTEHREGWVRAGGIQDLLAAYFDIDQTRLEAEKRAMLAKIQQGV